MIKFRAWLPHQLRMVEVCDLDMKGESISFIDYDGFYIVKWLSDVKLMQYSGLEDEYGREIYEGDILLDRQTEEYCKVIFEDGCYIAEFQTNIIELNEVVKDSEVVGNIYENPELIGDYIVKNHNGLCYKISAEEFEASYQETDNFIDLNKLKNYTCFTKGASLKEQIEKVREEYSEWQQADNIDEDISEGLDVITVIYNYLLMLGLTKEDSDKHIAKLDRYVEIGKYGK